MSMTTKSRMLTVLVANFFLLTIATSAARADSIHAREFRELKQGAQVKLELPALGQEENVAYLQSELFNHGKDLASACQVCVVAQRLDSLATTMA